MRRFRRVDVTKELHEMVKLDKTTVEKFNNFVREHEINIEHFIDGLFTDCYKHAANINILQLLFDLGCIIPDDALTCCLTFNNKKKSSDVLNWLISKGITFTLKYHNLPTSHNLFIYLQDRGTVNANKYQWIKDKYNIDELDQHNNNILFSLFHHRSANNNMDAFEWLCKNGIDINHQNNDGDTVLHCTTKDESHTFISSIIKYNCDKQIKNNDGKTPFDILEDNFKNSNNYQLLK
jgi:hypothetical protein